MWRVDASHENKTVFFQFLIARLIVSFISNYTNKQRYNNVDDDDGDDDGDDDIKVRFSYTKVMY